MRSVEPLVHVVSTAAVPTQRLHGSPSLLCSCTHRPHWKIWQALHKQLRWCLLLHNRQLDNKLSSNCDAMDVLSQPSGLSRVRRLLTACTSVRLGLAERRTASCGPCTSSSGGDLLARRNIRCQGQASVVQSRALCESEDDLTHSTDVEAMSMQPRLRFRTQIRIH